MDSSPTLQDFVLNLIYDPIARSNFELDPEGVLHDAGLGDVTAADVQEVIPLVVDYAPLADVSEVTGPFGASQVATGVGDLDVTGAVAQLQALNAQLVAGAHPVTDVTVASAGAVMVSSEGLLSGAPVVGAGLEHAVTVQTPTATTLDDSALSAVHDPGLGLDAGVSTATGVMATAVAGTDDLTAYTGVDAGATLDGTAHLVTGVASSVGLSDALDLDVAHLDPAVSSVVGSVTGSDPLGSVSADPAHGVLDVAGGVTAPATGLVDGLTHSATSEIGHDTHGTVTDLLF